MNNSAREQSFTTSTNFCLAALPAFAATMYYFVKNTKLQGYEFFLIPIIVFITVCAIASYVTTRKIILQLELNTAPSILLFGVYYFYVILHVMILHKLFVVLSIPFGYYLLPWVVMFACRWVLPFELYIIRRYPKNDERFIYLLLGGFCLSLLAFFSTLL